MLSRMRKCQSQHVLLHLKEYGDHLVINTCHKQVTSAKTINVQHPKNVKAVVRTIKNRLSSSKKVG